MQKKHTKYYQIFKFLRAIDNWIRIKKERHFFRLCSPASPKRHQQQQLYYVCNVHCSPYCGIKPYLSVLSVRFFPFQPFVCSSCSTLFNAFIVQFPYFHLFTSHFSEHTQNFCEFHFTQSSPFPVFSPIHANCYRTTELLKRRRKKRENAFVICTIHL